MYYIGRGQLWEPIVLKVDSDIRRRLRLRLGSRVMRRAGSKSRGAKPEHKPRNKLMAAILAWDKAGRPEVPRRK